jgi:hypothetical protein
MKCKQCNTINPPNSSTCVNCGTSLDNSLPVSTDHPISFSNLRDFPLGMYFYGLLFIFPVHLFILIPLGLMDSMKESSLFQFVSGFLLVGSGWIVSFLGELISLIVMYRFIKRKTYEILLFFHLSLTLIYIMFADSEWMSKIGTASSCILLIYTLCPGIMRTVRFRC